MASAYLKRVLSKLSLPCGRFAVDCPPPALSPARPELTAFSIPSDALLTVLISVQGFSPLS